MKSANVLKRVYSTTPSTFTKLTKASILRQHEKDVKETPDSLGLETYDEAEGKINDPKVNFMSALSAYKNYLKRREMEKKGPCDENHFPDYQHLARQPFTVDEFFDCIKGTEHDPDNWSVDKLEEFYFVPIPKPFTAGLYMKNLLAYRTLKKLGYAGHDQVELAKKYNISCGEPTLEWLMPSPAPFHTFEELVIIKEASKKE